MLLPGGLADHAVMHMCSVDLLVVCMWLLRFDISVNKRTDTLRLIVWMVTQPWPATANTLLTCAHLTACLHELAFQTTALRQRTLAPHRCM